MNDDLEMQIAVVGGGPAGLMAAETALAAGARVDLYDAMASVGRKFLLAGKGGMNLTHSDPPPPTDTVELLNLSGTVANIGGWFLTDDFGNPKKYVITGGTTINPNGFIPARRAE